MSMIMKAEYRHPDGEQRVEVMGEQDSMGRVAHIRFWMAHYSPGHPDGEHVRREHGRVFRHATLPEWCTEETRRRIPDAPAVTSICAFCCAELPQDLDAVRQHLEACPAHPMAVLRRERDTAQESVARLDAERDRLMGALRRGLDWVALVRETRDVEGVPIWRLNDLHDILALPGPLPGAPVTPAGVRSGEPPPA